VGTSVLGWILCATLALKRSRREPPPPRRPHQLRPPRWSGRWISPPAQTRISAASSRWTFVRSMFRAVKLLWVTSDRTNIRVCPKNFGQSCISTTTCSSPSSQSPGSRSSRSFFSPAGPPRTAIGSCCRKPPPPPLSRTPSREADASAGRTAPAAPVREVCARLAPTLPSEPVASADAGPGAQRDLGAERQP
jgi:hypothetical protein